MSAADMTRQPAAWAAAPSSQFQVRGMLLLCDSGKLPFERGDERPERLSGNCLRRTARVLHAHYELVALSQHQNVKDPRTPYPCAAGWRGDAQQRSRLWCWLAIPGRTVRRCDGSTGGGACMRHKRRRYLHRVSAGAWTVGSAAVAHERNCGSTSSGCGTGRGASGGCCNAGSCMCWRQAGACCRGRRL